MDRNSKQLFEMFSKLHAQTWFPNLKVRSEDWIHYVNQFSINLWAELKHIFEGIYSSIAGTLSPKVINPSSINDALTTLERKANAKGLSFITSAVTHLFEISYSYIVKTQTRNEETQEAEAEMVHKLCNIHIKTIDEVAIPINKFQILMFTKKQQAFISCKQQHHQKQLEYDQSIEGLVMISLPRNTTCSFASERYRLQTLPYLDTTVEASTIHIDVPVSALLNTSAKEIEAAMKSLEERSITSFSLEEAKEEMRQIKYHSNNKNRAFATIATIGTLTLVVITLASAAAHKRFVRNVTTPQNSTHKRHQAVSQNISMSTISTTDTLASTSETIKTPPTQSAQQDLDEVNRPIYSPTTAKPKKHAG